MFRSSTIIREPTQNLPEVISILKDPVKLRHYYAVVRQHVMEWRVCCMQHTQFQDMSHNRIINNDVISTNVFNINITSAGSVQVP